MFKKYLELKDYPLYYGSLEEDVLETLPKTITLTLGYDDELDVIRLHVDDELTRVLEQTYNAGSNPSVALGKGDIQSRILNRLVDEIKILSNEKTNFSIVEVGCGEGRLLDTLHGDGWDIKGFEIAPSDKLVKDFSNKGIKLINDIYTHDKLDEKVDMIFSYGVLEHIVELETFFTESNKGLKDGGVFCHVVPDSEAMLKQGNLRILSHQHVSYFTKDSLINLYKKFGFTEVDYKILTPGNSLMVYGYKKSTQINSVEKCIETENIVSHFSNTVLKSLEKLRNFLDENKNNKIAFYAGGMQEYLILNRKENIVFSNGDKEFFEKKFFIELPAIVDPKKLKSMDIDVIVIFASHYYEEINNYLLNDLSISKDIRIVSIDKIIS